MRGTQRVNNFIDNKNKTVTDQSTGLTWQQEEPGYMNWGAALDYCNKLDLDDKTDWRLPDIKEINSLVDESRYSPAIDKTYFPNAYYDRCYWSSTSYISYAEHALSICFNYDGFGYYDKNAVSYVRCVRGGVAASEYEIKVKAKGSGSGSVKSSPKGISFSYSKSSSGSASFSANSVVKLTAKGSSSKVSWGSSCKAAGGTATGNDTTTATCTVTVKKAATVTATFTKYYTIKAKAKGAGKGNVVSSVTGISFTYPTKKSDSGSYKKGSTVKISAKALASSKATWDGTCVKAGGKEKGNKTKTAQCTIKVTKAATITATFTK